MLIPALRPYDVIIIGGGIVGLATAWNLVHTYPDKSVIVIEKESAVATHQSGVRRGLLHSGIYYRPGSVKATGCLRSREEMMRFCQDYGIPVRHAAKSSSLRVNPSFPPFKNSIREANREISPVSSWGLLTSRK